MEISATWAGTIWKRSLARALNWYPTALKKVGIWMQNFGQLGAPRNGQRSVTAAGTFGLSGWVAHEGGSALDSAFTTTSIRRLRQLMSRSRSLLSRRSTKPKQERRVRADASRSQSRNPACLPRSLLFAKADVWSLPTSCPESARIPTSMAFLRRASVFACDRAHLLVWRRFGQTEVGFGGSGNELTEVREVGNKAMLEMRRPHTLMLWFGSGKAGFGKSNPLDGGERKRRLWRPFGRRGFCADMRWRCERGSAFARRGRRREDDERRASSRGWRTNSTFSWNVRSAGMRRRILVRLEMWWQRISAFPSPISRRSHTEW